ncbi:hypothetical protein [Streptomyces sp. NPDC050507]|uniref:hypothetical protein n=1 Tax=Streptomyces sp. NPDC050507 TaxID=3365619 RepID=UPI0037B4CF41
MASNALGAKAAILARLSAVPAFAGFQVTWSVPRVPERVWLMVGRVEWESTAWVTTRQVEETFRVEVVVNVIVPGGTAEEAERTAEDIADEARTALMAEPSLGGLAIACTVAPERVQSWPNPEGFEGQWTGVVSVTARKSR